MLTLLFLAGWLSPAPQASIECGNIVRTQTQPMRGPAGVSAVLKVSSEDDHSKNSHLCMADYQLLVTRPSVDEPLAVSLLSSDSDWGRSLSLQLSGFSHDGKRILGVLSEGGAHPMEQLFDYNTVDGKVELIDLQEQVALVVPKKCRATTDVIGTAENGAIAIQLGSPSHCAPESRWLINPNQQRPRRVTRGTPVLSLYQGEER